MKSWSYSSFLMIAAPPPPPPPVPTSNGTMNSNLMNPAAISHLLSNGSAQQILQTLPQMLTNHHVNSNPTTMITSLAQPLLSSNTPLLTPPGSQGTNRSPSSHYADSKIHTHTPSMPRNLSSPNPSNINRMYHNGELSISTIPVNNSSQSMKRSPSSLSPGGNESSTADLLVDSPSKCHFPKIKKIHL